MSELSLYLVCGLPGGGQDDALAADCFMPVATPLDHGPAEALASVAALRRLADQLDDTAVEQAMRQGWSWPEVAEALGVTRQPVHKKHAHRLIAAGVALRRR